MCSQEFILDALRQPSPAIAYAMSQRLSEAFPEHALTEGPACTFDPIDFAAGGQCSLSVKAEIHSQIATTWLGENKGLLRQPQNVWLEISWQGYELQVILMSWSDGLTAQRHCWVLA